MLNLTLIISVQQLEANRPASVFGTMVTGPPNLLKMGLVSLVIQVLLRLFLMLDITAV